MMFYSINFFEKYLEGIRKRYTFALATRKKRGVKNKTEYIEIMR